MVERRTLKLIDLRVAYASTTGTPEPTTISGTPEHPFFVPARGEYVAMGELEAGTVLRTTDGSRARVVGSERRQGSFEVFNFEVEDAHNYYVSSPRGSPGVLVHNTCAFTPRNSRTGVSTGLRDTTLNGRNYSVNSGHAWERGHKSGISPSSTGVSQNRLESSIVQDLDSFVEAGGRVPSPSPTNFDRTINVEGNSFGYRSVSLANGETRVVTYWVNP